MPKLENTSKFQILLALMGGNRRYYAGAAAAIIISTLFSYAGPLVLRFTIDSVIGDQPFHPPAVLADFHRLSSLPAALKNRIWICGGVLIVLTALQGLFSYLKGYWASIAAESAARKLRDQLYDQINRLPFLSQSSLDTGDLIQRCSSDIQTVRVFLENESIEVARIIIMIGTAIPVMIYLDIPMAGISMIALPIVVTFSYLFFIKIKSFYRDTAEAEARMSTVLQENLTGARLVRAFHRQDFEMNKFDQANQDYRNKNYRLIRLISIYWSLSAWLCMLQIAAVVATGAFFVAKGQLSLGTLTVFVTYITILVWPIRMLGRIMAEMSRSIVSLERLREILLMQPEQADTRTDIIPNHDLKGEIVFHDVSFSYADNDPQSLCNITFKAEPGQTVAILGPTGSGKSTLVNLLPRLLEYSSGSICIDGHELNQLDRAWLRNRIGVALQEPFLYSKTIKDNIHLGAEEKSEGHITRAAEIAAIHSTIEETFEEGYHTMVGERGITLSGGQRQRIAIARAILRDPPILIFDDSLSAVDSETDAKIQAALNQRRGRATTFIISHRISTISKADRILVLENGRLTQQGTHDQLASRPGLYQRICSIQNQVETELEAEMN